MTEHIATVAFGILALAFVRDVCAADPPKRPDAARTSASAPAVPENVAAWQFDSERDLQLWQPNAHLKMR